MYVFSFSCLGLGMQQAFRVLVFVFYTFSLKKESRKRILYLGLKKFTETCLNNIGTEPY